MYKLGYQEDSGLNSSSALTQLHHLENKDVSLFSQLFRSCVIHIYIIKISSLHPSPHSL